ncbi:histidine kinase [Flavobacterium sp. Sd200]|uniref:sensor histidine kinase n=1 Tax=Flavobacterium sp. Sd200 TaxID=2692211 RepID=UPI00136821DB|nr:histidine kinase [Flavobacterium sp. Sd200]MXN91201.1 histidine kinase [Flavobacterium sp. Sd200]
MLKKSTDVNNRIISLIIDDRYRLLRHVCMIASFVALSLSARVLFNLRELNKFSGNIEFYHNIMPHVVFAIIIYFNIYVLMPLFFGGRYLLYFVLVLLLIMTGFSFMNYITDTFFEPYRIGIKPEITDVKKIIAATIFVTPIILATTAARLMQKWIKDQQRISELNDITVRMELDALKNQINPHFLFNMLNNVNVLIKNSPAKAIAVVVKLSEFLRYQLYDNNEEKTSLLAETEFLSNFLNLEKIRRDNFNFSIKTETGVTNPINIYIPPNIFTTFVENAIKHSVDIMGNEVVIQIVLTMHDDRLNFTCSNTKSPDEVIVNTKAGGLGLANIKRRLELLYKDDYQITIEETAKQYTVNLNIPL